MTINYTEKKRPRASFTRRADTLDMPYLLQMQTELYRKFLQQHIPHDKRERIGLQKSFLDLFPVECSNGLVEMTFHGYSLEEPEFTVRECKERNLSYAAKIKVNLRLHIRDREDRARIKEVREEKNVYMGDLPLMTANGSFIINGTERVIVSQLHRAPSVYFTRDNSRQMHNNKINFNARMIPNAGSWLDFEFDSKELLYFRIDKRRKLHVSFLLRALGYTIDDLIKEFYDAEEFTIGPREDENKYQLRSEFLQGVSLPFDIKDTAGKPIIKASQRIKRGDLRRLEKENITEQIVPDEFIIDVRRAWEDVIDTEGGEVIIKTNETVTAEHLVRLRAAGITQLKTIYSNDNDCGMHIANTLQAQEKEYSINTGKKVDDIKRARDVIFRHLRPGDPITPEIVARTFNDTFFNPDRIDLSPIGRMKMNQRLGEHVEVRPTKLAEYTHTPRPAMEWCVLVGRNLKVSRGRLKAVQLRESVPEEQLSDEDVELIIAEIKDDSKRVVAWHLTEKEAKKIAKNLAEAGLVAEVREQFVLSRIDILNTVKMLIRLVNRKGNVDDIDSLGNRRIRMVGEFIQSEYESGLRRFHKAVTDRMALAESENMKPSDLVNAKTISQGVREFINTNQLSQFMDQNNPLAEITHKRRVSALGVGGLQRDRAGFEVRDVHPTHYGRLCPIETPEGPNIGLINSMALYSRINEYGFLTTPYRVVEDGKVTDKISWLSAVEEGDANIAQANSEIKPNGNFVQELVSCRRAGEFLFLRPDEIEYMDVAPAQIASVAAALIPFLEHDDSNRALMGSNMQRQAVPSLRPQKPLVGTGLEAKVAADSGHVVRAERGGTIEYVDAARIVVRATGTSTDEFGVDIYNLTKYMRSNQNTNINQRPLVRKGDKVAANDIIADAAATDTGELALGQNVQVAFLPWNGYNFEDSILVSERMVIENRFTTLHIEEHVCKARETRNGAEVITRDIPNQPDSALQHLDESGIVTIGTEVTPGDVLVGKVTPKAEHQPTPEERLLRAIFGSKGDDVKDTSLRMPSGARGTVVDVKVFTADAKSRDKRALAIIANELQAFKKDNEDRLAIYRRDADIEREKVCTNKAVAKAVVGLKAGQKVTKSWWQSASATERDKVALKDKEAQKKLEAITKRIREKKNELDRELKAQTRKLERNDELAHGVNKNIKVYVAIWRELKVGDKMAGRHGNKGVVSRIVPVEDMPYLQDGTPVDLVLNPLGVPSRMNIGQILETHLGLASKALGRQIEEMLTLQRKEAVAKLRAFLPKIYARKGMVRPLDLSKFSDTDLLEAARRLQDGIPFATPIFDGATEADIKEMLKLAKLPETAQVKLFDGRTGEPFSRAVTVGHKYMFKLHHLVDEKMHARSTGSYSLVTQQPLGGKAQGGGQRLGEMEVWALEAYGAAYTLWEMLTVKSDDRVGRNKVYDSICRGDVHLDPAVPESYKVLKSEIRALGINFEEE